LTFGVLLDVFLDAKATEPVWLDSRTTGGAKRVRVYLVQAKLNTRIIRKKRCGFPQILGGDCGKPQEKELVRNGGKALAII